MLKASGNVDTIYIRIRSLMVKYGICRSMGFKVTVTFWFSPDGFHENTPWSGTLKEVHMLCCAAVL